MNWDSSFPLTNSNAMYRMNLKTKYSYDDIALYPAAGKWISRFLESMIRAYEAIIPLDTPAGVRIIKLTKAATDEVIGDQTLSFNQPLILGIGNFKKKKEFIQAVSLMQTHMTQLIPSNKRDSNELIVLACYNQIVTLPSNYFLCTTMPVNRFLLLNYVHYQLKEDVLNRGELSSIKKHKNVFAQQEVLRVKTTLLGCLIKIVIQYYV